MSRAGATDKPRIGEIPDKPQAVQALEERMREQRMMNLYGQCRLKILGTVLPFPEIHGALIADHVLGQIMQQMIQAQSKIVVPKPGMMVPR